MMRVPKDDHSPRAVNRDALAEEVIAAILDTVRAMPDSPQKHDAWRLANDRLGLTVQIRSVGGASTTSSRQVSPKPTICPCKAARPVCRSALKRFRL